MEETTKPTTEQLAESIWNSRDIIKGMLGNEYPSKVGEYVETIRSIASETGKLHRDVWIGLLDELNKEGNAIQIMLAHAAFVEIFESTPIGCGGMKLARTTPAGGSDE